MMDLVYADVSHAAACLSSSVDSVGIWRGGGRLRA